MRVMFTHVGNATFKLTGVRDIANEKMGTEVEHQSDWVVVGTRCECVSIQPTGGGYSEGAYPIIQSLQKT
jgi:hypothetical protein